MADFQSYFILFLIWLFSTILVRKLLQKNQAKLHRPPSPFSLPVIGHLHLLAPIPHQALHNLSLRHGPLIHLFLGSVSCVVASSPEMAKEFLKTHESSFSDRPVIAAVDYLTYGSADFSFAPYGPYWKFMKKLCMSELLGGRILDQLQSIRHEEIRWLVQSMVKKADANEAVDVGKQLIRVSNNIISRMLMRERCSDDDYEADEVWKIVHEVAELTGKFNLSDFIWFCKKMDLQGFGKRLKVVRGKFDKMMERIIKEHIEATKKNLENDINGDQGKDILDILLDISENESSEMKLTMENIKAFILDIFAAGTDTSAITIEWALAELINNPQIMQKLREEIDSAVGKTRIVEESDIANLPYLQAIVKETLRLHPTGPLIVRESTKNCEISGYEIPARTRLFVNVWAIGRDPNHWDNPLTFYPERFMSSEGTGTSQVDVRGQHYHLLPFGSGRRGCPGTTLALQVVQTALGAMVQCFQWKVGGNGRVDMEEGVGLTLPRAHPLICIPSLRLHPFPLM